MQCAIKFEENNLGIFYNGSVVNGRVEILLQKPMSVRSIFLKLTGEANVYWTESETTGHGKDETTTSTTYSSNETYIHTNTALLTSPNGDTITINPGTHVYTFSCLLPPQIPSSLESHNGRIRYAAKVVFDRPWKFDKTFTVGFTVLNVTDLNYEHPSIRLPSTLEIQKTFCCWPCTSKPLILEANIPQSGYVSGQTIPVRVTLFNESGKNIHHVSVSLKKIIKCTSSYPSTKSKTSEDTVKKMVIGSIKNLPKEVMNVDLIVPPIPPTLTELTCRFIQIYYVLRVKAVIEGPHINPVISIPIIIGNIPLWNLTQSNETRTAPSAPNSPEISAADFGLPPPTYEEVLDIERKNMNDGEEHPIGESSYLPRYPVFHFEASAPQLFDKN